MIVLIPPIEINSQFPPKFNRLIHFNHKKTSYLSFAYYYGILKSIFCAHQS